MRLVACIVAVVVGMMVVSSIAEEAAAKAPAAAVCYVCKDCKAGAEKAGKCTCGKELAEMTVVEKKADGVKVCAKDNIKDGKVIDESACLTVKAAGEAKKVEKTQ